MLKIHYLLGEYVLVLSGMVVHTRDKNHAVPLSFSFFLDLRAESDHLGICCIYKVFNMQLTDNDKFNTSLCAAVVFFCVCMVCCLIRMLDSDFFVNI